VSQKSHISIAITRTVIKSTSLDITRLAYLDNRTTDPIASGEFEKRTVDF